MTERGKTAKKVKGGRLRIRVQAYESRVLDSSVKQILETVGRLETAVVGPVPLPTKIKKYSVNRAPFVFKTSQEQFEMRVHTRLLDIERPSSQVVEALGNLSLPAGVSVEAQMLS